MRVISVACQKRGVGTTTCAIALCQALGEMGHKVLLVDLDPQADATAMLRCDPSGGHMGTVMNIPPWDVGLAVRHNPTWEFDVAVSQLFLARFEEPQRWGEELDRLRLTKALYEQWDRWDYVLIDCPPSFGPLTFNAFMASRWVLAVCEPQYLSVYGPGDLQRVAWRVRNNWHASLDIGGVICNKWRFSPAEQEYLADVDLVFGGRAWHPPVPQRAVLAEMAVQGVPLRALDGRPGAKGLASLFARHAEAFIKADAAVFARWPHDDGPDPDHPLVVDEFPPESEYPPGWLEPVPDSEFFNQFYGDDSEDEDVDEDPGYDLNLRGDMLE